MAWFIGQSLVFIVFAFILGIIVGFVLGKARKMAPEAPVQAITVDDELERIEGVGPAMADALRTAGIRTFAQLAESGDDAKRAAIRAAGLTFAPSLTTWSRQARLLADGDEAAFEELTARLIAGRDSTTSRPAPKKAGATTTGAQKTGAQTEAGAR